MAYCERFKEHVILTLRTSPFLRSSCERLEQVLETSRWSKLEERQRVELEVVLTEVQSVAEELTLARHAKFGTVARYLAAQKNAGRLDACYNRVVELLEEDDASDFDITRLAGEEGRNQEELERERQLLLQSLEEEVNEDEDGDIGELLALCRQMDASSLERATRTTRARARHLMEKLSERSQAEEWALSTSISQQDLIFSEEFQPSNLESGCFAFIRLADTQPVMVRRFDGDDNMASLQALRQWQAIGHKNVARLFGECSLDSILCLVTEPCEMSLFEFLQGSTAESIDMTHFEKLARGILSGLEHLHAKHIIHRNLDPFNVLVSADFSNVKLARVGVIAAGQDTLSAYAAPEVKGSSAMWTTRADIYSFGLVCWDVIHRRNEKELAQQDANGKRLLSSEAFGETSWHLELIQACCEEENHRRPAANVALSLVGKKIRVKSGKSRILKGMMSLIRRKASKQSDEESFMKGKEEVARAIRAMENRPTYETGLKLLLALIESENFSQRNDSVQVKTLRKAAWKKGAGGVILSNLSMNLSMKGLQVEFSKEEDPRTLGMRAVAFIMQIPENADCAKALERDHKAGSIILKILRSEPDSAHLQESGIYVLLRLAVSASNKAKLFQAGAADVVLEAMQVHHKEEDIQRLACAALFYLGMNHHPNKLALQKAGASSAVVNAMQSHPSNAALQEMGCAALYCFAGHPQNRVVLAQSGAATAIVNAMLRHPMNEELQRYACRALWNLAKEEENHATLMQGTDVVGAILEAMQNYASSPSVLEKALGALSSLAIRTQHKKTLIQMGVVDVILTSMEAHRFDPAVQQMACSALSGITALAKLPSKGAFDGVADAVLSAMDTHAGDEAIHESVLGALYHLSTVQDQSEEGLLDPSKLANGLLTAMGLFPLNAPIQSLALLTFSNLSRSLIDERVKALARQAKRKHSSNAQVVQAADAVLLNSN